MRSSHYIGIFAVALHVLPDSGKYSMRQPRMLHSKLHAFLPIRHEEKGQ